MIKSNHKSSISRKIPIQGKTVIHRPLPRCHCHAHNSALPDCLALAGVEVANHLADNFAGMGPRPPPQVRVCFVEQAVVAVGSDETLVEVETTAVASVQGKRH